MWIVVAWVLLALGMSIILASLMGGGDPTDTKE